MGRINIALANGQLGATLQTNDGVVGLVCTGGIDGYTLGNSLLITSMANAATQGVTAVGSPFLYRQLSEFYEVAGSGAQIYVMPCTNTVTLAMMGDYATTLLNYAAGKIKVLAIITDDTEVYGGSVTIANGLNADVYTLLSSMATVAATFFAAQKPFRYIIGGTSYQGIPGNLADELTGTTNNRGAILIGDTENAPGSARDQACVGLLLGRISLIPVQRKVSRVKDGALPNLHAFIGAYDVTDPAHVGDPAVIAGRGYITWETYPNVAGFFFSGDDTCSATTDDYHFLARGRVIDKAHILAYATFVQEIDDEIPTVPGGTPDPGWAKTLEQSIVDQINDTMTANKEITGVDCSIDLTQDVLSTNILNIVLKERPVGYASDIEVSLGFEQ